ncbi:MAG: RagB/SusD family nutrient uptake outer membrane protein [Bacteroidota bacterium]|uniref:RagB/SusD family nutrient uptake outer membrane protein n=1 Tax=Macellibacteroides fermentans TaxID=879969 RepID=UPI000AF1DC48|nr:RagB/SusD family nutrient uptake outer membrane protein [Bacteroidota bacterium]MEA4808892.1 RagB/SusD family nutrient uptake outer membrane protein [Macellibacteroides fermentans]HML70440.1 RagB/SusD family nutrient uptake outer membrane protein [Macellibacteroides fermentans]
MKKVLYIAASALLFTSCESFLDTESYTKKTTGNYPVTEKDAIQLVTGVYATLNKPIANCQNTYFYLSELASDDRFGGGGENDKDMQVMDHLLYTNINRFQSFWTDRYSGINRANMAIANLDKVANETMRNQMMGETLTLRAFFYNELVEMFGSVPLITTVPQNVAEAQAYPAQSPVDEIYASIAADLKKAIEIMPNKKWNETVSGAGHLTKWTAEALLGRVFLFYTGFYGKESLPLMGEDGTISGSIGKDEVAAALKDCIDNSGHSLVSDYRSLWPYSNKLSKKDYPYVKNAPDWVKDGENPEQVFAIKCSHLADWSTTIGYSNQYMLHFAIRSHGGADQYKKLFPFGQGWGAGPVSPKLWKEWQAAEPNDPRREASILDGSKTEGYIYGADKQMEETGLWQKKIVATTGAKEYNADGTIKTLFNSFTSSQDYYGDGADDDFQLGHEIDLNVIRFADVLLMHSEITKTADGMNRVRARAGLPAVTYSETALRNERRWELAFEGTRWADIRRWGIAEQALSNQLGSDIWNRGVATVMKNQGAGYAARYAATKGFMPIPQSEIDLSNGVLKQNAGWDASAVFVSWNE